MIIPYFLTPPLRMPLSPYKYLFELRAGNDPTYLGYKSSASPLMLTKRKMEESFESGLY